MLAKHDEFFIAAMNCAYSEKPLSRMEAAAATQTAVTGTAEMMTKAWAIGPSSVMVRSMRAS
jgi:hypothetical protein